MNSFHHPSHARRRRALALLLLAIGWLGVTSVQAQGLQQRWVYGPGDPTSCGAIPGFPNLHAALEWVDPDRPVAIHVSVRYQHNVPAGSDPRVRITDAHAAPGGQIRLLGGKACSPSGAIIDHSPGSRSWLAAVAGGRILLVNRASDVLIEDIEFRGSRGGAGTVHPALHILGEGPATTRVHLRRVVVTNNASGNSGTVIIGGARVDIEGVRLTNNQSGNGSALQISDNAEVTITGLPSSPEFATTLIDNNTATISGGAILLSVPANAAIGPRLRLLGGDRADVPGVTFSRNAAGEKGGAIEVGGRSDLEVFGHVRFEDNSAVDGGAISINLDAASATAPRVRVVPADNGVRPVFASNVASRQGGAINCRLNDDTARNRAAIAVGPTLFRQNEAALRGGALHADGCRIDPVAGPGELEFLANRVTIGRADPAAEPEPRGGGALFVSRANATFGAGGAFVTVFEQNRVHRDDSFWGRHCGTQYCVLRGLSGGAVMLFDGGGFFYDTRFVGNVAPFGGAISAVDSSLTVDQSTTGCSQPQGCSRFFRNRANGAAYVETDASANRARRGYGAAIAVRNDRPVPGTNVHRTIRIERSRFVENGTGCTTGMSCALDPERLLRGRVIQANVPDGGQLIVRGNLFADNAQLDDVPTSSAQADDAEVSLYRRPPAVGEPRPVLLAVNTFWKGTHCPGAPWLVDVRDSTGQAGRIDVAANLLLGCTGNRNFTAQTQTAFGVYACNIASAPAPGHAVVQGHNQQQPAVDAFFADTAAGDFRLRDNVYGASATDICGTEVAGQSIVSLLQSLGTDLGGQPRPVRYGGGLVPEAGDWDVGAYERQSPSAQPLIFSDGFE